MRGVRLRTERERGRLLSGIVGLSRPSAELASTGRGRCSPRTRSALSSPPSEPKIDRRPRASRCSSHSSQHSGTRHHHTCQPLKVAVYMQQPTRSWSTPVPVRCAPPDAHTFTCRAWGLGPGAGRARAAGSALDACRIWSAGWGACRRPGGCTTAGAPGSHVIERSHRLLASQFPAARARVRRTKLVECGGEGLTAAGQHRFPREGGTGTDS